MQDLSEKHNVQLGLPTDDIFRTSYGVGHHWRSGFYFPDTNTLSKLSTETTCGLRPGDEITPKDHFETTNEKEFGPKHLSAELQNYRHAPPPPISQLNYINDFRSRYLTGGYHRPLSPSHQVSETHEAFQNIDGPSELWRPLSMQPFELSNHHEDGPSKKVIASTTNPPLGGRIHYPKDKEVLRYLDPYLTTTMKDHRYWTSEELKGYPKKDIATYQELEGYPKAWGFGLHSNPVPKEQAIRDTKPMRDTTVFKEATDHTRVRPVTFYVPHTGLKTLYQADFEAPSSVLSREDKICPVDTPFVLPDPDKRSTFSAPMMYQTEYSTIGQCERTLL
ncbi:unnamed protein product [Calicophoron daubneyi]|uniref:Uncharacterized protein n=1 Tax=Calicophoron daubneyi TaxID=300641 RepID=A0AAV2TL32_CALDB